ncbi:MAG: type II secretion system protein [Gammaproteobacteria bacterium]|nr:type II secretion system protein [Gammaproteobacteria bacterium]
MSTKRTHHLQGFTMIELVMVIVIIGILAAAALPRFANLSGQAQIAANQGIAGALRSSVGIAHAAWIAAGASSSASTVTLDNTGISINSNGWADGGAGSTSINAVQCVNALTTLLVSAPQTVTTGCTDTPCYIATASGNSCTYQLYSGTSSIAGRTITYNVSTGAVAAT